MPATESIYHNQILIQVPAGFKDLSARKLELDKLTDADPDILHEAYLSLAEEFEAINYQMVADVCRRRAEQWRLMR